METEKLLRFDHKFDHIIEKLLTLLSAGVLTYGYLAVSFKRTQNVFVLLFLFALHWMALRAWRKDKKKTFRVYERAVSFLCGFVFSCALLAGELIESGQFDTIGTLHGKIRVICCLAFRSVVFGILSRHFFCCLSDIDRKKCKGGGKIVNALAGWPLKKLWIVLTLCWFPYCALHFPARFGGGAGNQILQFYGQDTLAHSMSRVVYEGHFLSNHHPVLLTCLYGGFFKIGNLLGDANSAVFLLSCITLIISSFCMAYMLVKVRKYISPVWNMSLFVFACVYPVFGTYSYTCCKDNLFTDALILFYTFFMESIFKNKNTLHKERSFACRFLGVSMLIPFLKNQGLWIVMISFVLMAVFKKSMRKFAVMNIAATVFLYVILFSHILMPVFKIAPGGRQEALSVPFQQTALYLRSYEKELSPQEYHTINKMLPVDKIGAVYDPKRADAVKNTYRQEASFEDMKNYFVLWVRQLFKHPGVYLKAFLALTDGYYDLCYEEAILDLYPKLPVDVQLTGVSTPKWAEAFALKEDAFWTFLTGIPLIGCLFRTAVFSWVMFFTLFYAAYRKKSGWMLVMAPVFLNFAVTLLCPWNGVIRYGLPLIYAVPIEICILGKKASVLEERGACLDRLA